MCTVRVTILVVITVFGWVLNPLHSHARPAAKTVQSGKTQVVAKAGGREITLTELNVEMSRLRLSPNDAASENIALESIINRTLLSGEARKSEIHRRPEALVQMKAAQDQVLADLYLGITSQPAEPTLQDVEDYITQNPTLFSRRRKYTFSVMTLPTEAFDEKALTPLFDETKDFKKLESFLRAEKVEFALSSVAQPSSAFPEPIRKQLGKYGVSDNIVLQGDVQTQIMKIVRAQPSPFPAEDWSPLARNLLLEQKSLSRAEKLVKRLRDKASIAYYRESAKPKTVNGEKTAIVEEKNR